MLNCQEVSRLHSEAQDRELSLKENVSLKLHVVMCTGCRNFGKQMHTLRQAMQGFANGEDERSDRADE